MGHTSTVINSTGGICPIRDVSAVLLIAANGDWGYLCSNAHGKTNKWAKYKPERVNQVGDITDAQRSANSCGLGNIPYFRQAAYMTSFMKNIDQGITAAANASNYADMVIPEASEADADGIWWWYMAPRVGKDWMRITDFDGYDHAAKPIAGAATQSTFKVDLSNMLGVSFAVSGYDSTAVRLQDMGGQGWGVDGSALYFGVCIFNGSKELYKTAGKVSDIASAGTVWFTATQSTVPAGTWTAYAFASSIAIEEQTSQPNTGTSMAFIPLPMTKSTIRVEYETPTAEITSFFAFYNSQASTRAIYYTFIVKNTSVLAATCDSLSSSFAVGSYTDYITSFTVNPGMTHDSGTLAMAPSGLTSAISLVGKVATLTLVLKIGNQSITLSKTATVTNGVPRT